MATGKDSAPDRENGPAESSEPGLLLLLLKGLASLRLTVVLFAMLCFLVFAGTLAQKDQGVWQVVDQTYFRVFVAKIDFQALIRLVELWTHTESSGVPGWVPFPGGKLLGILLGLNLLAAHAIRFKVVAQGQRFALGLGVTTVGVLLGVALIALDQHGSVERVFTPGVENLLWHAIRASVAALALASIYRLVTNLDNKQHLLNIATGVLAMALSATALWLLWKPDARLDPSGMRILWLAAVCTAVAAVLLAGCVLLFKRRSGIVLIHAGVLLIMFGELLTGLTADEGQMQIPEGGSSNYAVDIRAVELAVVDTSDPEQDRVTVIPRGRLGGSQVIDVQELPFRIRPIKTLINSFLAPSTGEVENLATQGSGRSLVAVNVKPVSGVDTKQGVDRPSVYAEFLAKDSEESLGVYLLSTAGDRTGQSLLPQDLNVGGKRYQVELRFRRQYKSYSVELVDFRFDRYEGTDTPKNFSSDVIIRDPSRSVDRPAHISMNNPARHAGDTLYQQSYDQATEKLTVLQVVTNTGRLIPYLSCAMVSLGLLAHFGAMLVAFLGRVELSSEQSAVGWGSPVFLIPLAVGVLMSLYVLNQAGKARLSPSQLAANTVDRFGALAMVEGGRVKPFDSYARLVLQRLSDRQQIDLSKLPKEVQRPKCAGDLKEVPAAKWMLDMIAGKEGAEDYPIFRITNLDLLSTLGLDPRPGFFRYSLKEVTQDMDAIDRQLQLAEELKPEDRTLFHSQLAQLTTHLSQYRVTEGVFRTSGLAGTSEQASDQEAQRIAEFAIRLRRAKQGNTSILLGLPVPPAEADGAWKTLVEAEIEDYIAVRSGKQGSEAARALGGLLDAHRDGDERAVSDSLDTLEVALARHQKKLRSPLNAELIAGKNRSELLDIARTRFEVFFSRFSPYTTAAVMYLVAFLASVIGWLAAPRLLNRVATAIVLVALAVHVYAIFGRLYITARPPVTNLFSSAVFIGCAMVLAGLLVDWIFRLGIGVALGSIGGALTMLIAYLLGLDGDTYNVMQAVLDTQFWLATHVVCVALGYAATFMAGAFGLCYVAYRNPVLFCVATAVTVAVLLWQLPGVPLLAVALAPVGLVLLALALAFLAPAEASPQIEKIITRMTYGTLCFALVLSFIGTVLGGLWADDSWGRFWGWDPKENGALIVVIWNALILHARWGGLCKPPGIAALAIVGNIITTWSWFGTNELGVGLHAYGGVSDGLSLGMGIMTTVLLTHVPLIPLALLPANSWPRSSEQASGQLRRA